MPLRRRHRKKGGFLPLIPLLAAAIPAIASTVATGIDIARKAKALKEGQGIKRRRRRARNPMTGRFFKIKHGKGLAADIIGNIPLIGPLLGPLVSKMGGKVKRVRRVYARGRGLSNMRIEDLHHVMGGALMPLYHGAYMPKYQRMMMPARGGLLMAAGSGPGPKSVRGHFRHVRTGGAIKRIRVKAHKRRA